VNCNYYLNSFLVDECKTIYAFKYRIFFKIVVLLLCGDLLQANMIFRNIRLCFSSVISTNALFFKLAEEAMIRKKVITDYSKLCLARICF
jgi:hypothetical protein